MTIPGSLIRYRRMQLGITQQALANKAGISWAEVSRLENARSSIDPEILDAIAQALRLNLQSEELLTAYDKIPVRQRRRMMKVLEREYPDLFSLSA